ncbi:cache domain-containing sensor histidine kinase [Cohnella phaseoli]|uniref:Two-component system sensor histidine kinase YesM n=1 Tax=Cohnella phaseoli TaxID=456490 RepID=A0A3D9IP15_9BACL|nr:histidine kinase [Cohnella phaseoli]RED63481.1 two-component system sensor histidine kinase YesM [Cohnella phaseoli]
MRKPIVWLSFVNNIPLKWKFTLIYLLCVLLPILTINVLFFRQMSENIQTREQNNLQITIERAAKKTTDMIEGGVTLSHSIATDRNLYEVLDMEYADIVDFYESFNNVLSGKMRPFMSAYTYVENISVFTENPTLVAGSSFFILDEAAKRTPWYEAASASPSAVNVLMYTDVDPMNAKASKGYFSIVRRLNEYPMFGRYAKYLRIDLKLSSFDEILEQEEPYMTLSMLGPQNQVLFPSSQYLQKAVLQDNHGDDGLLFRSPLGTPSYIRDWKLVGIAEEDRFQTAVQSSKHFIWMLAAISTLLPTSLIFIMLRSYNYRIRRLSRHMEKAKNEKFDLIVLREGTDEIGGLIRSYNRMAAQIESLINDVYKLEIQQKDMELERIRAEMKLLQSQVNPHFLFNTLNALLVVSAKNGYTEVTDIIRNLSQMLRRMLSWTDSPVTLQDELHFTEMYLKIEKFRFSDRFDYVFNIEEEAAGCLLPKMCIQPIVENACKHGLQAVKGQRVIRIEARRTDAYLQVQIEDNGKGMNEERLTEIRSLMNGSLDADENVGIRNVYKRLRLHYGERVDFYIDSRTGEGTRVSFRIPALPLNEGGI